MLNGTCTHLQVRRVTGRSHTKMQWEKEIEKNDSSAGSGSGLELEIEATWQTLWPNSMLQTM